MGVQSAVRLQRGHSQVPWDDAKLLNGLLAVLPFGAAASSCPAFSSPCPNIHHVPLILMGPNAPRNTYQRMDRSTFGLYLV